MIQQGAASGEDRLKPPTAVAVKCAAVVVLAGAMASASLAGAPGAPGWFGAGLAVLMLAIAVIDARSLIIPNWLNLAAFLLALAAAAIGASPASWPGAALAVGLAMIRAAVLGLAFLALRALYWRLRGREGIGLGDVKLAAVAGAWLDWPLMPIAVEIAALAALAVYTLGRWAGKRPFDAAETLPFGLFFAPAIWLSWLIETGIFAF
jgi:leader peptidase (prepilin peptidase)/N-methyltransferase